MIEDTVKDQYEISEAENAFEGLVIAQIDDLSRLKIDFQVPERFIGKLRQGTPFTVRSKSIDAVERIQGEVYFVSAVIDRNGGKHVFVVDSGKVKLVPVTLGAPFGGGFELKAGPNPGTKVVKDPPAELTDGQSIKEGSA